MYAHRFGSVEEQFFSAPPLSNTSVTTTAPVVTAAAVASAANKPEISDGNTAQVLSVDSGTSLQQLRDLLATMIKEALKHIHLAMNYSEISKLNSYVENIQNQEKSRILETHESMANNLMLTQQMYLMQTRETDRLSSRVRVILFTMLAVSVVFAILPYAQTGLGVFLLVVVVLVYLVSIILYVRSSSLRRYDDWNKIYWGNDIKPADSVVTNIDDGDDGGEKC